jgi:hypothetical protein
VHTAMTSPRWRAVRRGPARSPLVVCACVCVCALSAAAPPRSIDEQLQDDRHSLRQSREQLVLQHHYQHEKRQSRERR